MKLFWPGHFDSKMSTRNESCAGVAHTNHQQPRATGPSEDIIEVNFRYTSLIAMCLGFLFVWSMFVSTIFLRSTFNQNSHFQMLEHKFEHEEQLSRLMFQIGQEMLFSIDVMVSVQMQLAVEDPETPLNFTYHLTSKTISEIRQELDPSNDFFENYFLLTIEKRLFNARHNLSITITSPFDVIGRYKALFDYSELYIRSIADMESTILNDSHIEKDQFVPYALFLKGMNRKFLELSYGTIYHIGSELFNKAEGAEKEQLMPNYYYFSYSSLELIEAAFSFDSNIRHRFTRQLEHNFHRIFYSKTTPKTGREYTTFVTDVVAYLLEAKNVLNECYREIFAQMQSRNGTVFYVMISLVYLIALAACIVFFVLFICNAKIKSNHQKQPIAPAATSQRY